MPPLILNSKAVGTIEVQSFKKQIVYTQEDLEVLQTFTSLIATIIEKLKNSQKLKLVNNAIESIHEGVITKSLTGIVTSWNKGAEKLLGYTSDEIIDNSIDIIIPELFLTKNNEVFEKICELCLSPRVPRSILS